LCRPNIDGAEVALETKETDVMYRGSSHHICRTYPVFRRTSQLQHSGDLQRFREV